MLNHKVEESILIQVAACEDPLANIIKRYLDRVIQLEKELLGLIEDARVSDGQTYQGNSQVQSIVVAADLLKS